MASLKSFLKHGHTVDLYLYDKTLIDYTHDNLNILDANDILLEREIFTYENGSYSAFSNLFRFTLLYKKGGYWCDLDLINLKKIDFSPDYVFVTEPDPDYKTSVPTSCLIKMPKNTYIGKKMIELCKKYIQQVKSGEIKWGLGPRVIKEIIEKYNLWNYTKTWKCVCSCHPNDCLSFVLDESLIKHRHLICRESDIPEEMYCVHLWNKVIGDHNILEKIISKNNFFTYLLNLQ